MLEVKKLTAVAGDKKILDDFNLSIMDGEVHAIMGPNGTGKSTLSKVIMGSDEYNIIYGDIIFNGESIKGLSTDSIARRGIFLSMQSPVSIDGITNAEFVKSAINARRDTPIGLYDFIKMVDVASSDLSISKEAVHRNLNVGASGGERKKNEIFQMKLLKPKLIILDELDSGLDVDSLRIVCENINSYLKENKDTSVLMITHYPRILQYIKPKYVHIMMNGKIVKTGDYNLALEVEKNGYSKINNLVIEEDTELVFNFNDTSRDIYIVVEDNICLNIVDISFNTSNKINITLKNDSRVIYNKFSINSGDYIYTLLDGEYSNVVINNSVVNNDDTKMKFVIEHNNTNTSSNLSNHGVNNSSGTLYFNVDSKINRSASLACADQENKIINLVKGDSKILPNLLVDNYDVSASHSAYISDFDKESMFYLKSRGISDNEARRLLLEGFLIGNLDVDDETKKNLLSYIKI